MISPRSSRDHAPAGAVVIHELMASALGGAQAMPHPGFDEAYAIPTEKSQSLALGTQQILAEETNITKTVDPLGGSYYIEWLTCRIEEAIVKKMTNVEERGGAIKAITDGFMQRDILEYFTREQQRIASGERVVVRKNKYRQEKAEDVESRIVLHRPDAEAVAIHVARLKKVKTERDNEAVQKCLGRLRREAEGRENLMPCLVEAAKAYSSIGEITQTLKGVWGSYKETLVV